MLMAERFKEASPSPASGWPEEVAQVVVLLDEFHLVVQEVFLQEVKEMGVSVGRTQGMQLQQDPVQGFL